MFLTGNTQKDQKVDAKPTIVDSQLRNEQMSDSAQNEEVPSDKPSSNGIHLYIMIWSGILKGITQLIFCIKVS